VKRKKTKATRVVNG